MTTTSVSSVRCLDYLIDRNRLTPRVDEYIERQMRNSPDSWYRRMVKEEGKGAAEEALVKWINERHLREFSEAIKPAAIGLRNLAEADKEEKYVKQVRSGNEGGTYLSRRLGTQGHLLIALNPEHHGCGCDTPEGYWAFGESGTLGLKAVVLGYSETEVVLALVLPNLFKQMDPTGNGITVISLDLEGNLNNESIAPSFNKDEFLKYSLRLTTMDKAVNILTYSGGSEDVCMGFPGSADYLAKHIGILGTYLTSTAAKLKSHKTKK